MAHINCGGFATAAGKPVPISAKALKLAESLLDEIVLPSCSDNAPTDADDGSSIEVPTKCAERSGLSFDNDLAKLVRKSTKSSKSVINPNLSCSDSHHKIDRPSKVSNPELDSGLVCVGIASNFPSTSASIPKAVGFTTASGRSFAISEESKQFARRFYNSTDDFGGELGLSADEDLGLTKFAQNCSNFQNIHQEAKSPEYINEQSVSNSLINYVTVSNNDESLSNLPGPFNQSPQQPPMNTTTVTKLLSSPIIPRKSPCISNSRLSPVISCKRRRPASSSSIGLKSNCKTVKLLGTKFPVNLYQNCKSITTRGSLASEGRPIAEPSCIPSLDSVGCEHENPTASSTIDRGVRFQSDGFLYRHRNELHRNRMGLSNILVGQFPQLYDKDELDEFQVDESTRMMSITDADNFCFRPEQLQTLSRDSITGCLLVGSDCTVRLKVEEGESISLEALASVFLNSLTTSDQDLVSLRWAVNHLRFIVWKLAALEVAFPHICGNKLFTITRVVDELRYRFDREISHCERSCLKKILECDDNCAKPMVLCVCGLADTDGQELCATAELTDGWYSVRAQLDQPLTVMLRNGRIRVGDKLFIVKAQLHGIESGFPPLEVPENVRLSINYNCVRRARWGARLGFHHTIPLHSVAFSLSSFRVEGGLIPAVKLAVARIYPVMFLERRPDGTKIVCSERQEDDARMEAEGNYERLVEKAREKLERQWATAAKNNCRRLSASALKDLQTGEELHRALESTEDMSHFRQYLSPAQVRKLETFNCSLNERKRVEIQREVDELCEKELGGARRKVTQFVKVRVLGTHPNDRKLINGTILTLWNPHGELTERLAEGKAFVVSNLQGRDSRTNKTNFCPVQLSTTRESVFRDLKMSSELLDRVCPRSKLSSLESLQNARQRFQFDEINLAGIVVELISAAASSGERVYLFDGDHSFVAVCFLKSLKELRLSTVCTPGSIVCLSHLYKKADKSRPSDSTSVAKGGSSLVPFLVAGDRSHVSVRSSSDLFREEAKRLSEFCKQNASYLGQARALLRSIRLGQREDLHLVTPSPLAGVRSGSAHGCSSIETPPSNVYRCASANLYGPNQNTTTPQPAGTTPLTSRRVAGIYTTPGLVPSSCSDTEASVRMRRRRDDCRRRQDQLSRMAAPPPLPSPEPVLHRSRTVFNEFKSPVISGN